MKVASPVKIRISTDLGDIDAEVYPAQAPTTASNFLQYVDDGFYDGGRFWRTVTLDNQPSDTVRIEVIQGGVNPVHAEDIRESIPLERTTVTGLSHRDGTLSMGRFAPDSAHSEFFICIGDQPELNFGGKRNPDGQGFAAFGQVTRGMDVVRRIQRSPCVGQRLTPPIRIVTIRRV
jgi:peptidyl-prolyl cis-trans isomerase A (cyclophilin A)